ncbi:MAG: NADPH:quinone oxidoreductase family protein [Alphaproteobacteria bacterium]|nr:NADPH:quinone oxidoreductase family protein [Alphaproteobacteria bacterium]
MKAVLCTHFGPPEELETQDIPAPVAGEGQAVVSVKACGVNFPDVLMIQGKYQARPSFPFAPGGEVAGVVKAVGSGVTHVKPGDRVCVSVGNGGFAEEVLADARRCQLLPDNVPFDVAASFTVTYGTSWHALVDRAQIKPGETLVVLGAAGGVGLSAVEIGHALGARVIAGASSQAKVDIALKNGADAGFVYPNVPLDRDQQKALTEQIKQLTGSQGADVLYDPVGDDYAEPALRAMNWNGRYLVIGFAAGKIPSVPLNLTLLKGFQIVGVFWGASLMRDPAHGLANQQRLLAMISEGKLKPFVSAHVPLMRASEALRLLMDRKATGKVVVTMD